MNSLDETLNISTPENVSFGFQVAGIGSRFMAAMIDTILIVVLQIVVNLPLFFVLLNILDTEIGERAFNWLIGLVGLIAFAFLWGYYIFFEIIWNGQSPGKRKIGLRVICANGLPITFSESVIRNLVRLIDFMPAFYGLGVVIMFINEQSRRLGDLAAGTIVVHDKGEISVDELSEAKSSLRPSVTALEEVNKLPLTRIPLRNIAIAEGYLTRHREFANPRSLAEPILKQLYDLMDAPVPEELSLLRIENLLTAIVYLYYKKGE